MESIAITSQHNETIEQNNYNVLINRIELFSQEYKEFFRNVTNILNEISEEI